MQLQQIPPQQVKHQEGTVYAKTYRADDWSKLIKYTDDSYAKTKFADWATDGYLSPAERESLKREGEAITKDFNGITGHTYYNSCASSAKTNFYNAYTGATCAVTYHTTIQNDDKTEPIKIVTGTSESHGYGWISNFHEAKETIRQHIDGKIKEAYNDSGYTDNKLTGYATTSQYEAYTGQVKTVQDSYTAMSQTISGLQADLTATTIEAKNLKSDANGTHWAILGTGDGAGSAKFSNGNVYFAADGSGYLGKSSGVTWNTNGDLWVTSLNTKALDESNKGAIKLRITP